MSASAHCTWGDGPDVMVEVRDNDGYGYEMVSGAKVHSFGLRAEDALALAQQLIRSASSAIQLRDEMGAHIRAITEAP